MIELTEQEKELFKEHDEELRESASYHVVDGLIDSYSSNNERVQITYGYIKRILLEVAKKRGLNINGDESFDMDALLNEIMDIPEELVDFNPIYFKSEEQLQNYVNGKTESMTSEEIESFLIYFRGFNGIGGLTDSFREYMTGYIPILAARIDQLEFESREDEQAADDWEFGDSDDVGEPTIEYSNGEEEQGDDDWELEDSDDVGEPTIEYSNEEDEQAADDWKLGNSDDVGEPIIEYSDGEEEWADWEGWEDAEGDFEFQESSGQDFSQVNEEDMKVTDEQLCEYIKYINSFPKLNEYKTNGKRVGEKLIELAKQRKLEEFYSDKSFVEEFKRIMAHETKKHTYHFHGTQDLESAKSIMQEGLGMMRESLSTTSYTEFTMDEVILYSRGLGGEIGRDAIIIIDEPITEDGKAKEIVEPLQSDKKIHFSPSGLQGLNGKPEYIVNPQYIVGYVDKRNKAIIYNPRYYAYSKFNKKNDRPNGVPYSNDRIVDGVLNAKVEELLEIREQKDLQQ